MPDGGPAPIASCPAQTWDGAATVVGVCCIFLRTNLENGTKSVQSVREIVRALSKTQKAKKITDKNHLGIFGHEKF